MRRFASRAAIAVAVLVGLVVPAAASAPAAAEFTHYKVTDLGTFGAQFAYAFGVNDQGWVTGIFGSTNQHTFIWRKGLMTDLGTLGGPNSGPGDFPLGQEPGKHGQIVGAAETAAADPLAEGFCDFLLRSSVSIATDRTCLPFMWQSNVMTALPTLGGTNGGANDMNRHGQVVGTAENTTLDPTCAPATHLHFEPVIWNEGAIKQLPTLGGDPDGNALAINDRGQAVGATGNCTTGFHGVLWTNGTAIDLGNLGGTNTNEPTDINNRGEVVGFSDLPGDLTFDAFRWRNGKMADLGKLPGDFGSLASAVNSQGQVVGASFDASFNGRAVIWQNGTITDLNTLTGAGSPLFLLQATGINSRGQIVGQGLQTSTGKLHAFLATPDEGEIAGASTARMATVLSSQSPHVLLPENVRRLLWQRLHVGPLVVALPASK